MTAIQTAIGKVRASATAFAHQLMKPPAESLEVRERCRRRTIRLLRAGRLVRTACEGCGAPDVQAHHENYQRPDHVRWVCRRCHTAVHRRGVLLPAKLPPHATDDEFCRWFTVTAVQVLASWPEPPPIRPMYVSRAEAMTIGHLSDDQLRKAVRAGEVKQRGRRYRRRDLEAL